MKNFGLLLIITQTIRKNGKKLDKILGKPKEGNDIRGILLA